MKEELSACVISKFNGYRFLRHSFRFEEKKDLIQINVAYEPTLNDQKPIVVLLQKLKKHIILVLKLKKVEKNHYRIEMQNNQLL